MKTTLAYHLLYLVISFMFTIWVARTLFKNGRIFLVDTFRGNEPLADSTNQLLVVGFYLVNFGFVAIAIRSGATPADAADLVAALGEKVGRVLLILGGMHFFNLAVFSKMRRRAREADADLGAATAYRSMPAELKERVAVRVPGTPAA
jgi:hypothetical protein